MKSFMDIFNLNEVKEYVKMKDELIMDKATQMLSEDKKIKEILDNSFSPFNSFTEAYISKGQSELLSFISESLKQQDQENIDEYIKMKFPINHSIILKNYNNS